VAKNGIFSRDADQKMRGSACLQKGNVAVCSLAIAPHWY
jgi:hypothetical protein